MAKFLVVKTFRDKETGQRIKLTGSSYISENEEWTDYLIKEGYLKSDDKKSSTINKDTVQIEEAVDNIKVEKATPKTTRKKPSTRKKASE